jgi:hypothetical protein
MDLAAHNAEDLYSLGNNILQAATDGSQNGHAQDAARHVTSALHIVDGTNATCNIPAGIAAADKSVREAISGINSVQAAASDAERALHTVNHGVVLAAGVNIPGPGLMADGHSQHAVAELVTYQQEILQVN